MKILIVSNGFPPSSYGGVEVYSYDLAHGLSERGHSITVFCRESNPASADYSRTEDYSGDVPVTRVVNDFKKVHSFEQTYTSREIEVIFEGLLQKVQPDLIHFNHLIALSVNLPLIAHQHSIPYIISLHDFWAICNRVNLVTWDGIRCPGPLQGGDCVKCIRSGPISHTFKGFLLRMAKKVIPFRARLGLRHFLKNRTPVTFPASAKDFSRRYQLFHKSLEMSKAILAPSAFLRSTFEENGYSKSLIQIFPLGIPIISQVRSQKPGSTRPVRFGFVGTIFLPKGSDILIQAFMQSAGENIALDIHGREDVDTIFAQDLRQVAQQDSRITFHGPFSPDKRTQIYRSMDVLVIPSRMPETFSLVAREALSVGTPVIAPRIGALTEIIQPGKNGYLYEPENVNELAAIISQISNDPEQLTQLDCPGPVKIETVEEHIEKLESLYLDVIRTAKA